MRRERLEDRASESTGADVVLDREHDGVGACPVGDAGIDRLDPARIDHSAGEALHLEPRRRLARHLDHPAHCKDDCVVTLADLLPASDRQRLDGQVRGCRHRALRIADRDRPVGRERGLQQRAQLGRVLRRCHLQVGDEPQV